MRKLSIIILLFIALTQPVMAMSYTAPTAPDSAQVYMPGDTESFGEGLWHVISSAIRERMPDIKEACRTCIYIMVTALMLSVFHGFSSTAKRVAAIVGVVAVGTLVLTSTDSLIHLGADTVAQIHEYGKLLLPVITASLASQGGVTASASLYTGTMLFSSVLTSLIANFIVPMIYVYIAICIIDNIMPNESFDGLKHFMKWIITWSIKIVLYVCTGYLGITGVISGSTDAAALKATKIAISGAVPVVGGILSDASETVLVSAGIMKNAVGIYGLIAIIALCIGPFLKIGIHYLLTKLTAAVCSVFSQKQVTKLVNDLSGAMGLILAMTGTACLLYLISIACFMKGVA